MSAKIKISFSPLGRLIKSRQGRHTLSFFVFLGISAILWGVLTLNEEDTYDMRLPVRLEHVPDTVTIVSTVPNYLNVSLRSKGSSMLKYEVGSEPELVVDFRRFASNNNLRLGDAEIKSLARNILPGSSIYLVSPDSFSISYTSRPGVLLPIEPIVHATSGPQATIIGRPTLSIDSAKVYSVGNLPQGLISVATEPINLSEINNDVTVKAKVLAPPRTRVIPDSVLVTVKVEPLIVKSRKIVIEPVNVPQGMKLITFPAQINVVYMVPMSLYNSVDPNFRVQADYQGINPEATSKRIKVRLSNVPPSLQNVYLESDSVEYIIEK